MPPIIDDQKCKKCFICVDICPQDVFSCIDKESIPHVLYPEECWHCCACVLDCPIEGAVRIRTPIPQLLCYK